MPDPLRVSATYPGVKGFLDAAYTCSHGVTPGQAGLTIPGKQPPGEPPLQIAETGDLILSDGRKTITIPDCKVVRAIIGDNGRQVTLTIEDRRWRWQFGEISGRYNIPAERDQTIPRGEAALFPLGNQPAQPPPIPRGEEPIRPETRKTAPELAVLCLGAMGEKNYDVSALDQNATPSVDWDGDNPALALQRLVEDEGCRIVYRPDSDNVVVCRLGEGADLPAGDTPFISDAPALTAKARPERLAMLGAPVRYQQRFLVEPVGYDFDGRIIPIDQLSYTPVFPAFGWTHCAPPNWPNIPAVIDVSGLEDTRPRTQDEAFALATRCIFRMFRVKLTGLDGKGDLKIPPDGGDDAVIKDLRQIRLLPFKNRATTDDVGRQMLEPAACYGRHTPLEAFRQGKDVIKGYEGTTAETEVHVPFHVDAEHQTIIFSDYCFAIKAGKYYPGEIVLECACELADATTWQYGRYRLEMPVEGGLNTKPAVFIRPEVIGTVTATYTAGNQLKEVTTNESDIRGRAEYYVRGELQKYLPADALEMTYPGLRDDVWPDGAIHQVTWRVGGAGSDNATTTASRNAEHSTYVPSYQERRRREETTLDLYRSFSPTSVAEIERQFGAQQRAALGSL